MAKTVCQPYLGLVLEEFCRVLTTDHEEVRPKPCNFPWKLVVCVAIVGLFLFHCFCGEVFMWLEVDFM
jgi:hypothetical protein